MDATQDIDAIIARIRDEAEREAASRAGRGDAHISPRPVPLLPLPRSAALPEADSYNYGQFTNLADEDFLERAYIAVLGREPDTNGRQTYLPLLRSGAMTPAAVLADLMKSEEGRTRGVLIDGLEPALRRERLTQRPLVRRALALGLSAVNLPRTIRTMRQSISLQNEQLRDTIIHANQILTEVRGAIGDVAAMARLADTGSVSARDSADGAVEQLKAIQHQVLEQTRQLSQLIAEARATLPDTVAQGEVVEAIDHHRHGDFYLALQLRFRGSSDEVAAKSIRYMPLVLDNRPVREGGVFLDIGCGRGEWLELLRSKSVACRGIDISEAMVAEAASRGFDVELADALDYLRRQPDESLSAISAFHVVEHIPFFALIDLVDEMRRVLKPGGMVLFETPNPENAVVGACTFNYDPTHQKPLPPELLNFLVEHRGFDSRIIRRPEDCAVGAPQSVFQPQDMQDWFRLPMDYAIYATKPATDASAAS